MKLTWRDQLTLGTSWLGWRLCCQSGHVIALVKCLKGHKPPGSLCNCQGWKGWHRRTDRVTKRAVRNSLKYAACPECESKEFKQLDDNAYVFQLSTFSFFAESWYDLWLAVQQEANSIGLLVLASRTHTIGDCQYGVRQLGLVGAYVGAWYVQQIWCIRHKNLPMLVRWRRPTTKGGKATRLK